VLAGTAVGVALVALIARVLEQTKVARENPST
jgi:hypothetical protein